MSWRTILPGGAAVALEFQCGTSTGVSRTLNSSGDRAAWTLLISKTGNIRKVRFRTGTVTTGDTVRVSIQDLDASGNPDPATIGSYYATQVIAAADDNTYFQVTLGADRAVTAGDIVAVVIDFSSYVAGNIGIAHGVLSLEAVLGTASPVYVDFYDGAAWTKSVGAVPQIVLEYDDGTVPHLPSCVPAIINTSLTYSSSSTPDENGNIITFGETTRVVGAEFFADTGGAVDVVLYNTNGTSALATETVNIAARSSTGRNKTAVLFSTPVTCVGGAKYRLVLKPTTTTSFSAVQSAHAAAAAGDLGVLLGGSDWHKTSRTDAGAWTDDTLRRVAIWPVIDAIEIGPTLTGGMQA